jgi:ornithine cyclodeaminase
MTIPAEQRPVFKIIGAPQVLTWLDKSPKKIFGRVHDAYLLHAADKTVNPDSYFLRFPDDNRNRIIALPASLESDDPIAGIKWISSFPSNIEKKLDRASAVLIINSRETGYPIACVEGSLISAARTAASAAIGALYVHSTPGQIATLGIIGAGPIAFRSVMLLLTLGWEIGQLRISDLSKDRAELFREKCKSFIKTIKIGDVESTIRESDMVLFATSAATPFVTELAWFAHAPTVLHMSLRDLSPEIIFASQNIADDVDHCLKAQTSLHLAYQECPDKNFMAGGIADMIHKKVKPNLSMPRIFSPFGMGILDLAVAQQILCDLEDRDVFTLRDFFPTPYDWCF